MQLGKWFDAYLEAEWNEAIRQQQKAANRKLLYAIKRQHPPTLSDQQERTMNSLKSLFRVLSYVAVVAAVGIAVYIWLAVAFTLPLGLLAIVLGLAALWLQNEAK